MRGGLTTHLIQVRNVKDLQVLQRDEARNLFNGKVGILTDVECPKIMPEKKRTVYTRSI